MQKKEYLHLFDLLAVCPRITRIATYDPVPVIRCVNALHPLGKAEVIHVLSQFREGKDDWQISGLCAILRVLFDVPPPPGYMPPLTMGLLSPPCPKDRRIVPLYPLILFHDIPLLTINWLGVGGGSPPIVQQDLEYFEKQGTVRKDLLRPPRHAVRLLPELKTSDQWLFGPRYLSKLSKGEQKTQDYYGTECIVPQLKSVEVAFR